MRRFIPWAVAAAMLGAAGLALAGWRLLTPHRDSYEEPAYTVESTHEAFEVRMYEPMLQAQVTVEGSRRQANQRGFQILAGYIFGGNQSQDSIEMTTPVSAAPASETIAMTTPVSAAPSGAGWTVSFTMPEKWTLDTLPTPDDERVRLVSVPARRAAVRTFSGRATPSRVEAEEQALFEALAAEGMDVPGAATVSQFDPPWVLGPWRRNEVSVHLDE